MRVALLVLAGASVSLAGCGAAHPGCTTRAVLSVSPQAAVVNSTAKPPSNQQQFTAASGLVPTSAATGCAIPALERLVHPVWMSSDPLHVSISSADDDTNGVAVCKGATSGPITLTATSGAGAGTITATAQLTCQ